jgi:polyisoprenyl-phosphate glycosyltransferase
MRLSVVVPVLNEHENAPALAARLREVLEPLTRDYELIFVDDGSTDGTDAVIAGLHAQDARVKLLSFSRNFGHQFALTAGLDHAEGDAVITMDGDFQHPPELIPEMVARWREGIQVVHTVRKDTEDASFAKKFSSNLYYSLFRKLTGVKGLQSAADFRLLDRKAVLALRQCRERARFLRGLAFWIGFRSCFLEFRAPPRRHGVTKYVLRRMLRLAADGILSFSATPLYFSLYLGLASLLFGFFYGAYAIYAKFAYQQVVQGWTSTVIVVSLFGGLQMFLLGMQGLYVGRIFEEIKQRPIYLVAHRVGFGG